jgi:hypothetical protein
MNKNRVLIAAFLVASVFILSACQFLPGSGLCAAQATMTTETRPVSGFNAVRSMALAAW